MPGPAPIAKRSRMRRFLPLLIVLAIGASLLPPAACSGLGRTCCCAGTADGTVPVPPGSTAFDRACCCGCPELASAPEEAAPRIPAPARTETPAPGTSLAAGTHVVPAALAAPERAPAPVQPLALAPPLLAPSAPLRI